MRLKNKKTGEIVEATDFNIISDYNSLAELNSEWEDVPEEPDKYWFINASGEICSIYEEDEEHEDTEACKEIGNYFSSREEAEKVAEKLKAWKRLKDKGFRFTLIPGLGSLDIEPGKFQIEINADMPEKWFCCDAVQEDLDTCFGGEE